LVTPSHAPTARERRVASHTATARPSVDLQLLNAFELRLDGEPVPLPQPAQRVLAYVALNDRPILRGTVAARLWLDGTEPHALGSLRSALWRLRRPGFALVDTSQGRLQLVPEVWVDVRDLMAWSRRQLDSAIVDDDADLGHVRYSGELLPDWYDDWVVLERERLREVHVRALEAYSDRLTTSGCFNRATEAALAAINDDPLRESAHRCLIRIYLAEGNEAKAIRCYRLFRTRVRDELGLGPSRQMEALVAGVMME
jgi:DNA-binding SARP family transcriptional activator